MIIINDNIVRHVLMFYTSTIFFSPIVRDILKQRVCELNGDLCFN